MSLFRIQAGKYRLPVTIQQRQFTQDSYGSTTEDWTTIYTTRAAILPLTGSEMFKADEINAQITHRIQLRYLPNVTPDMRILYNDRVFWITSVVNYQEKCVELQLYARELVK
jgi:SPP1 family predicted phage head-tail adaptor